jgi:hypothetical protein
MAPTSQDNWRRDHADQPVRLLVTCRLDGKPRPVVMV